jgi:hypothetical protein
VAEKICIVCLQDVAGKPRLKDALQRYYCKACYESLLAQGFTRPPTESQLSTIREPDDSAAAMPLTPKDNATPLPLEPGDNSAASNNTGG